MTFSELYQRYAKDWLIVDSYRKRGLFYRHLLSLPVQWRRNRYKGRILKLVEQKGDFPVLEEAGDPDLVVSLTSFPFRMPRLHLVVRSILMQEYLPGRILLTLSSDEFPGGISSLPKELTDLIPNGLEIAFIGGNIRAHNKYYRAFECYSDKAVVTLDDDCVYPPDIVGRLMKLHARFPKAVCANKHAEVQWDENGFYSYRQWGRAYPAEPEERLTYAALGYGGVLYPPHIYDSTILDSALFRKLAPLADDLWLKAVQIKLGIKVAVSGQPFYHPVVIPGTQKVKLMSANVGGNKNDEQLHNLNSHFGLLDILRRECGPVHVTGVEKR